jgi:hypothetical protein
VAGQLGLGKAQQPDLGLDLGGQISEGDGRVVGVQRQLQAGRGLRTDGHRLRRLEPVDGATRELQSLVRLRHDHLAARTAASMKLGALLDAHWPGAKQVLFRLASKFTLAFLAEFPTPQAAAQLDEHQLAAFCRRHAYRGRRRPAELLKRLQAAPTPAVGLDPTVLARLVDAQTQLLATLVDWFTSTNELHERIYAPYGPAFRWRRCRPRPITAMTVCSRRPWTPSLRSVRCPPSQSCTWTPATTISPAGRS